VPSFRPFRGVRYAGDAPSEPTDLSAVAAPPYDVVDDCDIAGWESRHACNSVRLILPRDEVDEGDRYAAARRRFDGWLADGTLVADERPCFYGYRMDYRDHRGAARHTAGVIGALGITDADVATILPHERTLPKAKSDRLALLDSVRANLDPIWGLSLATGLTELLAGAPVIATCDDEDGVRHTLARIDDDDRSSQISAVVGSAPIVLADGHHRYETARNHLAAHPHDEGAAAIMTFVVELRADELSIEPIHRLVAGIDADAVVAALADAFTIEVVGPNTADGVDDLEAAMAARPGIGLVTPGELMVLVADRAFADAALAAEPPVIRGIDAALVETVVVPRFGDATWTYRHSAHECAALVEKGAYDAAILLRAPTIDDTRAVAAAGERMPQKSTFFSPKPRTGMVFRSLDRP
jgi:uncharacterized protein (DUF1015 family)